MISIRKIFAICEKDFKGLSRNLFVLSGLVIVPIMAFLMGRGLYDEYSAQVATMFVTMNIMMNGANIICVMIAEEKEKYTLNVLSASTVSGLDFLLSKMLVTIVLTIVGNLLVYFMFGLLDSIPVGPFLLITSVAILPAAAIGAVIGIATKTQAAASSAVAPLAMIPILLPIIVPAESAAWDVLQYLFTEQVVDGLRSVYYSESFVSNLGIIGINFAVLFVVFLLFFKKKGLASE